MTPAFEAVPVTIVATAAMCLIGCTTHPMLCDVVGATSISTGRAAQFFALG
jgi:hypothetical protein